MIRAIIVDDELLIRKGLIMTLPWQKYGIEIIGEASNGRRALEFIENNEVDLLITDITMPVMSGIDLMKEVKSKYPEVYVVLITCHQDFEYIQTALRIGAIDYIVKTQIEDDKIEESLERISRTINSMRISENCEGRGLHVRPSDKKTGILFVPLNIGNECSFPIQPDWLQEELRVDMAGNSLFYMVRDEAYPILEECFQREAALKEWILVRVRNIHSIQKNELAGLIKQYESSILFYACSPEIRLYEIDAAAITGFAAEDDYKDFYQLKKDWSKVLCIFNNTEYERLKSLTLEIKPDNSKVKSLFYKAAVEWEASLLVTIPDTFFDILESAQFWFHYEKWFLNLRGYITGKINKAFYPEETVDLILSSLEYIKQSPMKDIDQKIVARHLNFSRSYFSKAFKDIMGINFSNYIKSIRLENAKKQLLQTDIPIYKIAEDSGFDDEKYFSRIFKEMVGSTPVEYRNQKKCR